MKKSLTIILSISIILIIVSSATAIPYENSKPIINKIDIMEDIQTYSKEQIKEVIISIISKLFGIFYIFLSIVSLFYTGVLLLIAWLALQFNPGGFMILALAIYPALLTLLFLTGGLTLLENYNPMINVIVIVMLSFIILITEVLLNLSGYSINQLIKLFISEIIEFIIPN